MILVDMYIPAVDATFDFFLDENTIIEKVIIEITEMISKKVKGGRNRGSEEFLLYSMDEKKMLEKTKTLYSSGVRDGCKLMLV